MNDKRRNMKLRMLFAAVGGVLLWADASAGDTLSIASRRAGEYEQAGTMRRQVWQNVAMRYDKLPFSLTEIRVDGLTEKRGEAALAQQGNEAEEWGAAVSSFFVLDGQSRLFGEASYRNGRREHLLWNENSDFEYLYPYVTGDSIGGFMKEETYRFSGGYAYRSGRWTAGAELAYRAVTAYRDKDPRPRNTVSDLTVGAAASCRINGRYRVGLSADYRIYSQKSDIAFLADKGSTSVYQMLGLGMDYVRFAGLQTSARYRGNGAGGSLDLLPVDAENGLSVSLRADYFHLTKELPNLNNAPINENALTDVSLEAAWNRRAAAWKYGVMLDVAMQRRSGTENIFGDPTGNVYPQISSVDPFKQTSFRAALRGMAGQPVSAVRRWGWSVKPFVAYGQTEPKYESAGRYVKVASLQGGLQAEAAWRQEKWLWTAGVSGSRLSNLKADYVLPGLSADRSVTQALLSNIRYAGDDRTACAVSLRGDWWADARYALFFAASCRYGKYKECGKAHKVELAVGCVF